MGVFNGSPVMRLEGKVAVVTGAGQTQGEGIGNGRAAAVLFAREGAKLVPGIIAE
jgi:NAD(P)-dependent dehydrogenase (short-subunit alcohol dehydrogenase family)